MNDLDNGLYINKHIRAAHVARSRYIRAFASSMLSSLTGNGSSNPKSPTVQDGAAG